MRSGQFLRYSLVCRLIIKESRKLKLHRFAHAQYWVLWSDFERIGNQRKGIMGIVIHMRRVRGDGEGDLCRHDTLQLADLISGGDRYRVLVKLATNGHKSIALWRNLD